MRVTGRPADMPLAVSASEGAGLGRGDGGAGLTTGNRLLRSDDWRGAGSGGSDAGIGGGDCAGGAGVGVGVVVGWPGVVKVTLAVAGLTSAPWAVSANVRLTGPAPPIVT